jgi:hypothetical protein
VTFEVGDRASSPALARTGWHADSFLSVSTRLAGWLWLLTMHGPDGENYPNESRFTRIVPDQLFEIERLAAEVLRGKSAR